MRHLTYILLLFTAIGFSQTRYVSVSGSGTQDGTSAANSWTMAQALANDAPGMTIYVAPGNYSAFAISSSGTQGNPIKYIGYTSTPGDIVASEGSTFTYGDTVNASTMPLLDGNQTLGTAISVTGNYVELHNFQITEWRGHPTDWNNKPPALNWNASNGVINNVILTDLGYQNNTYYDGKGIVVWNDNNLITNCYIENSTAEAFKIKTGNYNTVQYMEVRADNVTNPMDYYVLIADGGSYNIVEDSYVWRASGLAHGGHGLIIKNGGENNIIRRCTTRFTNVELAFPTTQNNLVEDIRMIGQGTSGSYWHTNIDLRNGAQYNTIRNVYMTDVWSAINFSEDAESVAVLGSNNRLENIVVENANRIFQFIGYVNIGGSYAAPGNGNVFDGCTFVNYGLLGAIYNANSGNQMINCALKDGNLGVVASNGYTDNFTYTTNNYDNVNHTAYGGGTTFASGFTGTGTGVDRFQLTSSSALQNLGTTTTNTTDYYGTTRVAGSWDLGFAQEGDYIPPTPDPGDTTAPTASNINVTNITDTSFSVDWNLDEGSKGRIRFGTSTGVYTDSTATENNYLTYHAQTVGGTNPAPLSAGTTYYWQIYKEDIEGNSGYHTEQTTTTTGAGEPPVDPPPSSNVIFYGSGTKSRHLKLKKN